MPLHGSGEELLVSQLAGAPSRCSTCVLHHPILRTLVFLAAAADLFILVSSVHTGCQGKASAAGGENGLVSNAEPGVELSRWIK
jgi:hypothetical protein